MKKYFIANWKAYVNAKQCMELLHWFNNQFLKKKRSQEILIAPPQTLLGYGQFMAHEYKLPYYFVGQNIFTEDSGAYTGETTVDILKSLKVKYCLVGHSERRKYFGESDNEVNKKIHLLLQNNITPIVCIGEDGAVRKSGKSKSFITQQLKKCLKGVDAANVIIAYEPLWAISGYKGSKPATIEEIDLMHIHISQRVGDNVPVLYGGSVNSQNCGEIIDLNSVNGILVGSASTKLAELEKMIDFFR